MILNRRTLFLSAAASTVAAPAIARARSIEDHPLLLNARVYADRTIAPFVSAADQYRQKHWRDNFVGITRRFLELHGDDLYPNWNAVLRTPRNTRKELVAVHTFELAYDGVPPGFTDETYIAFCRDWMVDKIYQGHVRLRQHYGEIRPYLVLSTGGVHINPNSFEPEMNLDSYFAV